MKHLMKCRVCAAVLTATMIFTQSGLGVSAQGTSTATNGTSIVQTMTEGEQPEGTEGNSTEKSSTQSSTGTATGTAGTTTQTNTATTETAVTTETSTETATTTTETLTTNTETTTTTQTKKAKAESEKLFSEMPESYKLSSSQIESKEKLRSCIGDIEGYTAGVDYADGEVVCLADSEDEAREIAESYNCKDGDYSYSYGVLVIHIPQEYSVMDTVKAASEEGSNLVAVWPNYICRVCDDTTETAAETVDYSADAEPTESTTETEDTIKAMGSNDPFLDETNGSYQWQHDMVGDAYAWAAGYKGSGIKVAIIDSGLLTSHEDLSANCVTGKDFACGAQGTAYTKDPHGHGTHVSGIIGAANNNGHGGSGIAPKATIRGYRALGDDGSGTNADIMEAIKAAVYDGYDIINMSLGGPGYNGAFQTVIDNAYNAGVAVFAAAGNESTNACSYPASYDHVICIAALEQSRSIANFSNYSRTVDLAFPGVGIYSTYNENDSSYTAMNGTSQATPVAAGTAAVLLGAADDIPALKGKTGPAKVDALKSVMCSSAVRASSPGTGSGTTYLPKALGLSTSATRPNAPKFDKKSGIFNSKSVDVAITAETYDGVKVYYTTDGKTPGYKNGTPVNGTLLPNNGKVSLTGSQRITLKAVAVNTKNGICSAVTTAVYTLKPTPTAVTVSSVNGVTKIDKGKTLALKAEMTPAYSCSLRAAWSVSPKDQGVTVNSNGVARATAKAIAGTYTVTAQAVGADQKTYNGAKGTLKIYVEAQQIKSIKFAQRTYTLTTTKSAPSPTVDVSNGIQVLNKANKNLGKSYVIWSSSNKSVATVSSGIVTASKPGKVTITALANDGSGRKATATVTVYAKVTKIDISGVQKVAKGRSIQLKAALSPEKPTNARLTWSVNPAKQGVTVSNGRVIASGKAAAGAYTITASAQDGSGISCNYGVTVTSGAITSIALDKKTMTLFTTSGHTSAATTATLNKTVNGTTGYDKNLCTYTSSAPSIAAVDEATGKVTARSAGRAVITCASTDGSNKRAACTVTVKIPMSRLSLAPTKGLKNYVGVGSSLILSATYGNAYGTPSDKHITWSSSDTSVATVSSGGAVKGVKESSYGTVATITATATDGSGVKAEYKIKVTPKVSKVYVDISQDNGGVYVYAFTDKGSSGYYSETVSNASGLGIGDSGYVDAKYLYPQKPGTYTIKMTLLDGSNKSGSVRVKCYWSNKKWNYLRLR